jgi:hypothetical protein
MTLAGALLLAAVWGAVWALFLQATTLGRWLAMRRTWLTVVIGVGVDLLILLLVLDWASWATAAAVTAASSVGLIVRSIYNEHAEDAG